MTFADWLTNFKTTFPEFKVILNELGQDVTDATLTKYCNLAMNLLPQGMVEYFTRDRLYTVVDYMVAHLLMSDDILNNYGSTTSLLKNASSMGANGLTISYTEIAKLTGNAFATLNDFVNTTQYGKKVSIYLDQMAGSVGGFTV